MNIYFRLSILLLFLFTGCTLPVNRTYFKPIPTEKIKAHISNYKGYHKTAKDALLGTVDGITIKIKPWLNRGENIYVSITFIYEKGPLNIKANNIILIANDKRYKPISSSVEDREHITFDNRNSVGDERISFIHVEYPVISDKLDKLEIKIPNFIFKNKKIISKELYFKFKKETVSDIRFYTING